MIIWDYILFGMYIADLFLCLIFKLYSFRDGWHINVINKTKILMLSIEHGFLFGILKNNIYPPKNQPPNRLYYMPLLLINPNI